MEFDLKSLDRDWVEGISGQELLARVLNRAKSIQGQDQLIVINQTDPHSFIVDFFAAILVGRSIARANPKWGALERKQFDTRIGPGTVPLDCLSSGANYSNADCQNKMILVPTGGTTNGIKLAIHTWKTLEAACEGVKQFLGGAPIDSCCVLPLYHISGFIQLLRAYHSGGYIRFDDCLLYTSPSPRD